MKQKAILEVEIVSTARKMQVLLGKMSRILNFLTIPDLENFIDNARILSIDNMEPKENSHLPEWSPRRAGAFSCHQGLSQESYQEC